MRRLQQVRALGLAVLVAVLTACAGVQTQSEVREGLDTTTGQENRVRVVFPGPEPGATPEDVVRGFVRAGSASEGDYDSARMFLTAEAARDWVPDGEIVLFAGDSTLTVTASEEGQVTMSGTVTATVSADGVYTAQPAGTQRTLQFSMARVDDEWRVSGLATDFGRWLPANTALTLIAPYSVHYVARDRRALINDVRWLPIDHLASRLARAQLSPVPDYLAGVATSAIPSDTRLTANSVTVLDGVAMVDLETRAPTDEVTRENLWAQFVGTLTQDPRVAGVVITIAGAPVELVGRPSPVQAPSDVGFVLPSPATLPTPMVRRDDRLYVYDTQAALVGSDPGGASATVASGRPRIPADQVDLALSADGGEIASVSADRATLSRWYADARREVPFFGTALGAPSYDVRGTLWIGALAAPGSAAPQASLFTIATKANLSSSSPQTAVGIEADWLVGRRVLRSLVSPDGERIAVLSQLDTPDNEDLRLDVAGIVRSDVGAPTGLAVPRRLGSGLVDLRGVTWVDDTRLAALGRLTQESPTSVFLLGLGGDQSALPEIATGESITTTGGLRGLVVVTSTGEIQTRIGAQWIVSSTGTDLLAHPN
ncbi:MAG: GerMN domain-containing protein [Phycicoccus sp.]|nr:GerMN domain-containing protein [Phycicoccus sp.]